MSETIPVPRDLQRRLWGALWAAVAFMVLTTVQGLFRDGYDAWHQAVSALSLGPAGWVQTINLVAFGAVITSITPAWRRILAGGTGARAYPILNALLGVSLIVVGLIPQDPAPGYDPAGLALQAPTVRGLSHLVFAGVAALCSVVSLFVIASRLARDPAWVGWASSARVVAILTVACVAVFGVWSVRSSGFAGTFERFAIVLPLAWTAAFLWRLGTGAPFMLRAQDRRT